jgi:hypothetical protein
VVQDESFAQSLSAKGHELFGRRAIIAVHQQMNASREISDSSYCLDGHVNALAADEARNGTNHECIVRDSHRVPGLGPGGN